ncbi:Piso0_002397 [Millerozyma farinosa CBS 7064]|uniref:Piso0_002397 protein n=1 Tax=Pichia sorbitophila (strain ATCC MYA-4447 / BCRC 22081 / CBS 7064 / NBRC 10061 / NRRL Y-12695) TaxID=559304 RepID=G8YEY2_PICSO|nr:Piso0_002397 [Millerozyma farinosa CBS 7064]
MRPRDADEARCLSHVYVKNTLQWDRRRASRLSGRIVASGGSSVSAVDVSATAVTKPLRDLQSITGAKTTSSRQLSAAAAIPVAGANTASTARQETYMDQNNSFLLFPQKRTTNPTCA